MRGVIGNTFGSNPKTIGSSPVAFLGNNLVRYAQNMKGVELFGN